MIDDDEEEALLLYHAFIAWQPSIELNWYASVQAFLDNHPTAAKARLILLDYNLPGQTGKDWLPTFLAHPCCQGVPVVLFTGSESKKVHQEAIQAGAANVFVKPETQEEMKELVKHFARTWLSG
ncbi:hypothetical protein GCM10028804_53940 [Larkinella terrae]